MYSSTRTEAAALSGHIQEGIANLRKTLDSTRAGVVLSDHENKSVGAHLSSDEENQIYMQSKRASAHGSLN